ncbi:MAG: membrane protein insertion efficiency factor YidD [Bacteroidetes bacterium]|nr:MAG: membrane protein insertion efficiency factor YidD [Bacteroidota bacterium]
MKRCCQHTHQQTSAGNRTASVWLRLLALPFVAVIRFYQLVISPWLGPKCRFQPTCSQYALEAFKKHGPFKGFWLALKRIGRCHPWGGSGWDPVP